MRDCADNDYREGRENDMNFIKLHLDDNGEVLINLDNVTIMHENLTGEGTRIYTNDNDFTVVIESLKEIQNLIELRYPVIER